MGTVSLDSGERGGRRVATGGIGTTSEAARERLAGFERELWALALLALAGDVVLTLYGLEQGLTEANPVARAAVARYGYVALLGLKGAALGVGVLGWLALPRRYGVVIPLALALPWTVAVVVNAVMLATLA